MAAVGSEKSASRFGWTGLVRPSSVSRKPTGLLLAELCGDLGQLLQPPLQRGVRREDVGQARAAALTPGALERRGEVERVQCLCLAQVPGGNPGHGPAHLGQRAGECRFLADQPRTSAIYTLSLSHSYPTHQSQEHRL